MANGSQRISWFFAGLGALVLILNSAPSQAQQAEGEKRAVPGGLEEIVVTAERGEDQLQKVGQAIEAFTPEDLEVRGIEDVHGLAFNTPNFVMTSGLAQPNLRGISSDIVATGIESGLALHINNVFVPGLHVASIFELFDMRGVEVLYGPQGTLFGRATDGGTLNYLTQVPTFNEWESWANVDVDTLQKVGVQAVLNVPVVDEKFALRFGVNQEWPEHTYDVGSNAGHLQDLETAWSGHGMTLRGSARWRATDNLMVDAMVNWTRNKTAGGATRYFGALDNGSYIPYPTPEQYAGLRGDGALYAAAAAAAGIAPGTPPSAMTPAQLAAISGFRRSFWNTGYGAPTGILSWTDGSGWLETCDNAKLAAADLGGYNAGGRTPCEQVFGNATPQSGDEYDLNWNRRQSQRYDQMISILKLEYQAENYTLTSTTSYQYLDFIIDRDNDGSDLDIQRLILDYEEDSTGQELLLNGSWGDFDVVLGTNYTYYRQPELRVPIWDYQRNAELQNYVVLDGVTFAPEMWPTRAGPVASVFQPMPASIPSVIDIDTTTHAQYFGVFGNLAWHATDRLTLRGGLRYSSTRREMADDSKAPVLFDCNGYLTDVIPGVDGNTLCSSGLLGVVLDPTITRFMLNLAGGLDANLQTVRYHPKHSWKSMTWEARGEYQITDDNMVFVRVSQAEAPGGLNYWWRASQFESLASPGGGTIDESVDAQTTFAVEAGSKNRFFDNRLQVNLAGFWYKYEDKLIEVPTPGVSGVVTAFDNVPDSRVFGGELTIKGLPTPELLVEAKLGYLDAAYDSDYFIERDALDAACPIGRGEPIIGCEQVLLNINGNQIARSPDWTVNLGVSYNLEFDWGRIIPRVDFTWKDDYYLAPYYNTSGLQESYTHTNVRIRYERPDNKYYIEIYGENLEDEVVKNQQEWRDSHPSMWLYPPRLFGIKVGYTFM